MRVDHICSPLASSASLQHIVLETGWRSSEGLWAGGTEEAPEPSLQPHLLLLFADILLCRVI